jgi:hypothetical protein
MGLAGRVQFNVGADGGTHQGAHGAVQSMPVVAAELGVGALERRVTVSLRLLDTAGHHVSMPSLVHFARRSMHGAGAIGVGSCALETGSVRTRSCGSSSTGCAETSSLTLRCC